MIVEGEDRYGEGVNLAARLQQLAEPGGVCVSAKVAREVEKTLAFGFEPMGEQRVKNIATPIAVYRVMLDRGGAPAQRRRLKPTIPRWAWLIAAALLLVVASGTTAWYEFVRPSLPQVVAGHVPSIAVLPLDNLSDDKEQGYLADGITDDLTTALAGIPGLFVISRDAAFTYKGKNVLPAQIAKELGVRYILEGSVRRGGNDMRLNAQLIDTQTGGHIWAERFDGQWTDVFTLQDKLVGAIADALKLRLVTGEGKAKIAGGTSNPAAYEAFPRGLELELRGTPEDIAKAVPLYQQALTLDPNFGRAIAELAWVYWNATDAVAKALGFSGNTWDNVNEYLDAAAKHPSPTYYQVLGDWLVHQNKSDEAIADLEKAIALDASDAWSYEEMSYALTFNGRAADGRGYVDAAMRVDPGWTPWRYFLGRARLFFHGPVRGRHRVARKDHSAGRPLVQFLWPYPAAVRRWASRPQRRFRRGQGEVEAGLGRGQSFRVDRAACAKQLCLQELRRHQAAPRRVAQGGGAGAARGLRSKIEGPAQRRANKDAFLRPRDPRSGNCQRWDVLAQDRSGWNLPRHHRPALLRGHRLDRRRLAVHRSPDEAPSVPRGLSQPGGDIRGPERVSVLSRHRSLRVLSREVMQALWTAGSPPFSRPMWWATPHS